MQAASTEKASTARSRNIVKCHGSVQKEAGRKHPRSVIPRTLPCHPERSAAKSKDFTVSHIKIPRPRREAGEGLRENWFARQIARTEGAIGISAEMPAIEIPRLRSG